MVLCCPPLTLTLISKLGTWLPLSWSCVVIVPPDDAHPGSYRACIFGRNLQPQPRNSRGLTPVYDATGGHMTQADPATYSSLFLHNPLFRNWHAPTTPDRIL